MSPHITNRTSKQDSMAASKQSSGTTGGSSNHHVRSRSQQQITGGRGQKKKESSKLNVPNPVEPKDSLIPNASYEPKTDQVERKLHKLDPNKDENQPILLIYTIETKNCTIEAFVRENTNL